MKCKHCFAYEVGTKFIECTSKRRLELVDSIIKSGIQEVVFASMEPLMVEDIPVLISTLIDNDIKVSIITNGVLLEDEKVFENILGTGLENIFVSMEGISAETNDYIRGKGSYESVFNVLKSLNWYCKNVRHIKFGVQMSVNALNTKEAEEIVDFFQQFDEMTLLTLGDIGDVGNAHYNKELILSDEEFVKNCERIVASSIGKKLNYQLMFKSLLPHEINVLNMKYKTNLVPIPPGCGLTQGAYTILPDGDIYPCSLLKDKIKDGYRFYDFQDNIIIRNLEFEELINKQIEEIKRNNICFECKYSLECKPCLNTLLNDRSMFLRCEKAQKEADKLSQNIINNSIDTIKVKSKVDFIVHSLSNRIFARKRINGGYWSLAYRLNRKRLKCIDALSSSEKNQGAFLSEIQENKEFLRELIIDGFLEGDVIL